jgi:Flp pilus assembly secretin CpaC
MDYVHLNGVPYVGSFPVIGTLVREQGLPHQVLQALPRCA